MTEVQEICFTKSSKQIQAEIDFQINVQGEDPNGNLVSEFKYELEITKLRESKEKLCKLN